jgi:hypothetical protein
MSASEKVQAVSAMADKLLNENATQTETSSTLKDNRTAVTGNGGTVNASCTIEDAGLGAVTFVNVDMYPSPDPIVSWDLSVQGLSTGEFRQLNGLTFPTYHQNAYVGLNGAQSAVVVQGTAQGLIYPKEVLPQVVNCTDQRVP